MLCARHCILLFLMVPIAYSQPRSPSGPPNSGPAAGQRPPPPGQAPPPGHGPPPGSMQSSMQSGQLPPGQQPQRKPPPPPPGPGAHPMHPPGQGGLQSQTGPNMQPQQQQNNPYNNHVGQTQHVQFPPPGGPVFGSPPGGPVFGSPIGPPEMPGPYPYDPQPPPQGPIGTIQEDNFGTVVKEINPPPSKDVPIYEQEVYDQPPLTPEEQEIVETGIITAMKVIAGEAIKEVEQDQAEFQDVEQAKQQLGVVDTSNVRTSKGHPSVRLLDLTNSVWVATLLLSAIVDSILNSSLLPYY